MRGRKGRAGEGLGMHPLTHRFKIQARAGGRALKTLRCFCSSFQGRRGGGGRFQGRGYRDALEPSKHFKAKQRGNKQLGAGWEGGGVGP